MKTIITGLFLVLCCGVRSQTLMVHFEFNKSTLDKKAMSQIDSFMAVTDPNGKIELAGHCDFIGSDEFNIALSRRRVLAVKNYIEENYVVDDDIATVDAFGEKKPIDKNTTDDARQLNRRVEIRILSGKETGLKQKIADTATTVGSNITLRNINFVGGRHQLLPESMPMLEELLDVMRSYPKLIIRIEGHICCQQYDTDGLDGQTGIYNLSEARAKTVRDYLIENNIATTRVASLGYGHSHPIYPYPEKTEEERIANRRVEIKIISK